LRRGLAFLSDGRPLDYGARLSRLRWVRAAGTETAPIADWNPGDRASLALGEAESWVFVPDAETLPLPPPEGTAHTLRELELAASGSAAGEGPATALSFRPSDQPPRDGETIEIYIRRLLESAGLFHAVPSFPVGDVSANERPEIVDRLPAGAESSRVLDLGCGSGGLGRARARRPGWRLTGVERDPLRAARARSTGGYECVLEGDIAGVLPALAEEGARFDALVFADVLEHLENPVEIMAASRAVADGGALMIVSVPNVAHLSVARDLLLGRHDPVPAGLCDSGHLRWFSKSFLAEAIEEAGWRLELIEGILGAPPPDPEPFLALARTWPEADIESLSAYQWIATARAR
jgi:2-polyprenyl-3-methyl-5-hydroxy-6-metoxy-1,4-benzoquinol methylase